MHMQGSTKELPSAKTLHEAGTSTTIEGSGPQETKDGCVSLLPVVRTARKSVVRSATEQRIEGEERKKARTIGGGQGEAGGGGGGGMLWEGEYDEKASAQSFQEALAEWRAGHVSQKTDNITGWCSQQSVRVVV